MFHDGTVYCPFLSTLNLPPEVEVDKNSIPSRCQTMRPRGRSAFRKHNDQVSGKLSTTMKFCNHLQRVVELSDPEWTAYWINYKKLKVGRLWWL